MLIVINVSDMLGGYGDFVFACRAAEVVREVLDDLRVMDAEIIVVTGPKGMGKAEDIKLAEYFKLQFFQKKDLEEKLIREDKQIDLLLDGPAFLLARYQRLSLTTPIILSFEYSIQGRIDQSAIQGYYKKHANHLSVFKTGLAEQEDGIFVVDSLVQAAKDRQEGSSHKLLNHWQQMNPDILQFLLSSPPADINALSIENYYAAHEVYFGYAHKELDQFFGIQMACAQYSKKNQDVVVVQRGNEIDKLKDRLPILISQGYNKIIYWNKEDKVQVVLYDEGKLDGKVYRLMHARDLPIKDMVIFHAISESLTSVTGDQSFTEAISADKILHYECLPHKQQLLIAYLNLFNQMDAVSPATKEAVRLMQAAMTGAEYDSLAVLLQDPLVKQEIHQVNQHIIDQHNFTILLKARVTDIIEPLLKKENDNSIIKSM
jgi:hypothetical protein